MPIIKHISIHSTPLSNIEYILNGEKNDEMKFATGLNCSVNPQSAYDEFRRSFEYYAKERFFKSDLNFQNFNSDEKTKSKEKVRIHHYVQSFDPKENVSPEEAHKIGIEWAKKTFGENMQVIVSTHLDKGHIHNHFAVCPYDLNGKRWIDNMNTLKRARKISDEIALEHGLHIIESPKHKNTMKYSEWLAKQNGVSWKNQLAADIDKLILREDVQSVSDLADKMKEQGYTVRSGKYLSVKAPKQKNAIRSFRLGDGYSVDDLQYRILHKEREISLTAIQSYSGVQREYAFCMRQMQIAVFTKKPKRATYSDLRKSTELLNFLTENNITSADELENRLNAAAEKEEYKKVSYIEKMSIGNSDDIEQRRQNVEKLKSELADIDVTLEKQKEERNYVAELFKVYKRDIENNPYEEYQRQLEAEQQEQQAEQERQEENHNRGAR
ncbi:MAG: relaxase/mobilization nuclease domain-containing protein [Ruminococcus sp.]|nr:relaxase/mobilization nuclease domain-containing protein [Ruminococcus sp.]MCM1478981.1 relaxase/mobilization nuclease domain-containing protein [Muribaculaceae bacterium]